MAQPTLLSAFRLSLFVLSFSLLVFSFTAAAYAQNSTGEIRLTTSPLPINLTTTPGKTIATDLRIRNSGNQVETLKTGLLKFTAQGESGTPKLMTRQPGDDYFDWVTFSPSTFTLQPNEWQTVVMTIHVPATAAFGYYYAVTFSRANEQVQGNPQATLVGAPATLVLLDVEAPGAKRELSVTHFGTDKSWYEFLPVTFNATIRNTGNVHAAPHGNIFISQGKTQVTSLDMNKAMGNVLPDSSRAFSASWQDGFPVYMSKTQDGKTVTNSHGQPEQQLTWNFSHADRLRFGKYTAHLVLAYDNGTRDVPLEATTSFWVIPWQLMLGGLVVGIFVLIGIFSVGRWLWRKVRRDEF